MESLVRLEEKIREMVKKLESLRSENLKLKKKLNDLTMEQKTEESEKDQIKHKVTELIGLIDSIKNEE